MGKTEKESQKKCEIVSQNNQSNQWSEKGSILETRWNQDGIRVLIDRSSEGVSINQWR